MTADLVERLRDADSRFGYYDARGQWVQAAPLFCEAADAIDAYDGTTLRNNILRKQVEILDARLAAAERVVEAARVVAEDYGGRLTGPEEHLVVALKATEANSAQVVTLEFATPKSTTTELSKP